MISGLVNAAALMLFWTVVVPVFVLILFVGLVPEGFAALPPEFLDSATYLFGIALAFNYFFPIATLYTILKFTLIAQSVFIVWYVFRWSVDVYTGAGR